MGGRKKQSYCRCLPVRSAFSLAFHFLAPRVFRRRARLAPGPIVQLEPHPDVAERDDQERQDELHDGGDGAEYLRKTK